MIRPPDIHRPPQRVPFRVAGLSGMLVGALLGGTINALNAPLRPEAYAINYGSGPAILIVKPDLIGGFLHGAVVGAILGSFLSVLFAMSVGALTGHCCTFGFLWRHLLLGMAGVCVCWFIGGLVGLGLVALNPFTGWNPFRPQTALVGDPIVVLGHAWAGGSTCGAVLGAMLSAAGMLELLNRKWFYSHPESSE